MKKKIYDSPLMIEEGHVENVLTDSSDGLEVSEVIYRGDGSEADRYSWNDFFS